MLKLDLKAVRKGKPVGLPYQGSKKKIAKQIVQIIKQNFGIGKPIYDVFGGGGAITAECLIQGLNVHYNDGCPVSAAMLQRVLSQDREWIKTLLIDRAEFLRIRALPEKSTDDELKLLVNSFGNNRKGYLYGKAIADAKFQLAAEILVKHDCFAGYKQTVTWQKQYRELEQLERLQQLQQLQQLEQLKITTLDYRAFSDVKGAVFYLDPPYENSDTDGYTQQDFDHAAFYDWAYGMAQENVVLMSSYEISDKRFHEVFRFEKARSTLAANGKGNDRCEKLFMVV